MYIDTLLHHVGSHCQVWGTSAVRFRLMATVVVPLLSPGNTASVQMKQKTFRLETQV